MQQHINIYPYKKKLVVFMLCCGGIFVAVGLFYLVYALMSGFDVRFFGGDWQAVYTVIQGLIFFYFAWLAMRNRKYYFACDQAEVRFFLPASGPEEHIAIKSITSVDITLHTIIFETENQKYTLNLREVPFFETKRIKGFFVGLKSMA